MTRPREGILDTSVVIDLAMVDPSSLPELPLITAITLAELGVGPLVASDPLVRATRQAHLQMAESSFDALPFDAAAARSFGQVAASLRASGRKTSTRAYDAQIAAVALSRGLPLFTANPRDFAGIVGLEVRTVERRDA